MSTSNIVPPFRAPLIADQASENGSGQATTARSWYLFFENLSRTVGIQAGMVSSGTHQDRLAASTADLPDGAFWVESDPPGGGVLYQMRGGKWYYVAGTKWGTMSPDQRPVDLTANDAGYEWRSTDQPPRNFLWSGTQWVEVTAVRYGTHANRLAVTLSGIWQGVLWVETDRGNVIYENQGGAWKYVAGAMWGTISPDQRPADLGANDYGFDFKDTNNSPFREYVWNGSAWNLVNFPSLWTAGTAGAIYYNSGNVGIGITNPAVNLSLGTAIAPVKLAIYDGGTSNCYGIGISSGILTFGAGINPTSGTPQMVLDNSGRVGIGKTNPGYQLELSLDSGAKPSTSTWSVTSDVRTKQNVADVADDSLALLEHLRWVRFEYNGLGNTPKKQKAIGLSAQETREHLPEAVRGTKGKLAADDAEETELLAIDYHHIFVHTSRAVQQLAKELRELKQKLAP